MENICGIRCLTSASVKVISPARNNPTKTVIYDAVIIHCHLYCVNNIRVQQIIDIKTGPLLS